MREDEIEFFQKQLDELKDGASIVEWGSGGSTLMILDNLKPNQRFFSIEHDQEWGNKVIERATNHKNNNQFIYIITGLPTMNTKTEDGVELLHTDYEEHKKYMMGKFLEENPCYIANYIDPTTLDKAFKDILKSDFFLVDGLARGAVLATLKLKGKKGAKVILHDYLGREYEYAWAVRLYKKAETFNSFLILTI